MSLKPSRPAALSKASNFGCISSRRRMSSRKRARVKAKMSKAPMVPATTTQRMPIQKPKRVPAAMAMTDSGKKKVVRMMNSRQ